MDELSEKVAELYILKKVMAVSILYYPLPIFFFAYFLRIYYRNKKNLLNN